MKNLEIFLIVISLMVVMVSHILMVVPTVHIMDPSEQQFHAILNLVMGIVLVGIFSRFFIFYLY
jgi:hypothetical protein